MSYETALTLKSLREATHRCARGVRYKESVAEYYLHSLTRNVRLKSEIESGRYKISPYTEFWVTSPKKRLVSATRFRDRVWQKSMCNNGVRKEMTKDFIYDNGACQENKGTDFAIDRIICFLQKFYRKHKREGYYLHLDVKGYFPNTPHTVSKKAISDRVTDERYVEHLHMIIDSFRDRRDQEEINADPFAKEAQHSARRYRSSRSWLCRLISIMP